MQTNKRRGRKIKTETDITPNYWLTGHLFCGECNAPMSGISGTSHTGDKHYYYSCTGHRNKKCSKHNISKKEIESVVEAILKDCINDSTVRTLISEKVYEYYQREHASDDSYLLSIEANLKETKRQLDNITKAIADGIYNEYTKQKMDELMQSKSMYEDELNAEQNRQKYSLKPEHVEKYLECFSGDLSNPVIRARVLDFLINKIYVYNDKIVISIYYSDDTREVNIEAFNEQLAIIEKAKELMSEEFKIPKEYEDRFEEYFKYVTGAGLRELNETENPCFFG